MTDIPDPMSEIELPEECEIARSVCNVLIDGAQNGENAFSTLAAGIIIAVQGLELKLNRIESLISGER